MRLALAILLSLATWLAAWAFAGVSVLIAILTCYEGCSEAGETWRDDPSSWVFDAIGYLGLAGLALATLFSSR